MGELEEVRRWDALFLVATLLLVTVSQASTNKGRTYGTSRLKEVFAQAEEEWMNNRGECGVALRQGRRRYQEDRAICLPNILLPGPGGCFDHGIQVGLFGVFDGHNGGEASELVSTYLPHLLRYHTWYIATHGINEDLKDQRTTLNPGFERSIPKYTNEMLEKHFQKKCGQMEFSKFSYRMILKEALSRALSDLDSMIINEQSASGSTAVVVLKVDRKLLVANIGDSKAFLCSSLSKSGTKTFVEHNETNEIGSGSQGYVSSVSVKELTIDHRPDRLDEKNRIEAAGGFVSMWDDVARVNGQLAVSRAIGDAPFKRYGVISEPEFKEWQNLSTEDFCLVITSDGIFETMSTEDVCAHIHVYLKDERPHESVFSQTLADFVVDLAFRNGSTDNLAAVVYLLNSSDLELNTTEQSSIQIWSERLTENEGGHLVAVQEDEHCYELIERFPTGVVLPLQLSGTRPSSAITGDVLNGWRTNESYLPYRTGYFGNVQLYQENVICFSWPLLSETDELCMNPEMFSKYMMLIGSVPETEINSTRWDKGSGADQRDFYAYSRVHERYVLTKHIGRGSFGEVWSATGKPCSGDSEYVSRLSDLSKRQHEYLNLDSENTNSITTPMKTITDSQETSFVIKRILAEKGRPVYLSGIREQYFGKMFLNARKLRDNRSGGTEDELDHIARYIESFEANEEGDLWLVFHNEGHSLSSLLYTADKTMDRGHIRILEPSNWWKWLRTTKDGRREMRSLLYQLFQAVKACHDRNITHRDIKPENMMVRATSRCSNLVEADEQLEYPCNLTMRLIDFGSAVDSYSYQNLYGTKGPSRAEQTEEYTPPESFMQSNWLKTYGKYVTRYDIWSIGVVMLELVLGTPHVFQISARTRALIDQQLDGWGSSARDTAYMLRALMEMCILYPINTNLHRPAVKSDNADLASWKCTEENLMQQIKERDPLGVGLEDVWALRLLRGLLQWYPEDRLTVEDAMKHPYFHPHLQGPERY